MGTKNGEINGSKWLKLSLRTPSPLVESVSDLMGVLSGSGVEVRPENEGSSLVSGFFSLEQGEGDQSIVGSARSEFAALFHLYRQPLPEIVVEVIDDQDWANSWKRFFTPVQIVPGLVIKPSWHEYQAEGTEKVLEMDPGQAFGTGQHESTRMALSLLRSCCLEQQQPIRVLDVGTGTGILGMGAAMFGAESVVAIDNDPEAVRVAMENVANNNLANKITVSSMPLTDIRGSYTLILANIVHDVLVDMAPLLQRLLAPGGMIVLAGILAGEQEQNILRVYQCQKMTLLKSLHEGEWAAMGLG